MFCVAALVVGCGGSGSDALRVSLDDVDPSGGFWTIRAPDEELRRHTPTGADLAQPTFEPTRLSCIADGSLVVKAHPVLTMQNAIVGGGFRVERDGDAIVRGAILREEFEDPASQLQWWRELCRPA